jgi:NAD(P)-dependent dehydrogenase (short-subunit alcohol dehydrogenase family)
MKHLSGRGILDRGTLARRTPMGRLGHPGEIGAAAAFSACDACSFLTGEAPTADGGGSAYGDV